MKYKPIIQELLSDDFSISIKSNWIFVEQSNNILESGWKLHITATPNTAPIVLIVSIPILVRYDCDFKLCSSSEMLNNLNGRTGPQSQTGKFMTIYPDPKTIRTMAKELVRSLDGLVGPDVPTDKPLKLNSIVSYRYGAFKSKKRINKDGEIEHIYKFDGKEVKDQRNVYFSPPF